MDDVEDIIVQMLGELGKERPEKLKETVKKRSGRSKATINRRYSAMKASGIIEVSSLEGESVLWVQLAQAGQKRYQQLVTRMDQVDETFPSEFERYVDEFERACVRNVYDKGMGFKIIQFKKTLMELNAYRNPFPREINEKMYCAVLFFLATRDIINNLLTVPREQVARCIDETIKPIDVEFYANKVADYYSFKHYAVVDGQLSIDVFLNPESEIIQILQGLCHLLIKKWFINNGLLSRREIETVIRREGGRERIQDMRQEVKAAIYGLERGLPELRRNRFMEPFIDEVFIKELVKIAGRFVYDIIQRNRD